MTFCKGDPETMLALKPRLRVVVNTNPWIAGKFVAKKLVHPTMGSDAIVAELLSGAKCAAVSRRTKYPDLVKAISQNADLVVSKGAVIQKKGMRITKLVVVEPETAGGEFALVFSMSHAAADGHNYYRIYNMIAGNAPVEVLTRKN